jgi:hypothetical protein
VDVLDDRGKVRAYDPLALGTAVPDVVQGRGAPAGIVSRLGDVLIAAEVLAPSAFARPAPLPVLREVPGLGGTAIGPIQAWVLTVSKVAVTTLLVVA